MSSDVSHPRCIWWYFFYLILVLLGTIGTFEVGVDCYPMFACITSRNKLVGSIFGFLYTSTWWVIVWALEYAYVYYTSVCILCLFFDIYVYSLCCALCNPCWLLQNRELGSGHTEFIVIFYFALYDPLNLIYFAVSGSKLLTNVSLEPLLDKVSCWHVVGQ